MVDTLHTVDQGVASHVLGNVMWLYAIVRRVFGAGGTQESAINALQRHLDEWYKNNRVAKESCLQGKLTIERIRSSKGWPKLKAKAACTRHLAAYAVHLAQRFGTAEDRPVMAVCQDLLRLYQILDSEPMFLSPSAKLAISKVGTRLATLYSSLAQSALESRQRMWKLMPKLHIFASVRVASHCIRQSTILLDVRR